VGIKKQRKLRWLHFLGGLKETRLYLIIKKIILSIICLTFLVKLKKKCRRGKGQRALLGFVGQIKGKQGLPQPPPVTLYFNNRAQFIASTTSTRAREASMSPASFSLVNSIGRS
jgi:hypothetical protein